MRINGAEKEYTGRISLTKLLEQENYQTGRIAVELNGEIVPKKTYHEVFVKEEDSLEIVSFMGGG